jgi:outer membrane biosynthesis protein TonB
MPWHAQAECGVLISNDGLDTPTVGAHTVEWLEQNLDAYRIIAEILKDLREVLRTELERRDGKEWYKAGLPDGLLDRLVEIKEQEKSIDWYESEYQQIMGYAVFPDLLQILELNAEDFSQIMQLAPTTALLNARFLELEVMRSKLGRARPISDTELAFLGTFHLRFRKAIDDFRAASPADRAAAAGAVASPQVKPPAPAAPEPEPAPEPVPEPAPEPAPEPEPEPAVEPEPDADLLVEEALEPVDVVEEPPAEDAKEETAPQGPPQRPVQAAADAPTDDEAIAEAEGATPDTDAIEVIEEGATAKDGAGASEAEQAEMTIEEALEKDDRAYILRALYQEITNTAEGIWSKDVLPMRNVWDKVSTSNWYEQNFSQLGLKPVSDFYEIMSKVDSRMRQGASKSDLQDYLKQSNFARVLLSLRDMFQGHEI